MLIKRLVSIFVPSLGFSSSAGPRILKTGDILRQTRTFSELDVLEYAKPGVIYVSQSLNFKLPVYIGEEIVGEVQATKIKENNKRYVMKFATRCFKNGGVLVIDGEAMAVLPTLAVEEASM